MCQFHRDTICLFFPLYANACTLWIASCLFRISTHSSLQVILLFRKSVKSLMYYDDDVMIRAGGHVLDGGLGTQPVGG